MSGERYQNPERVVAFMDLGTNSVRLLVVRIHADQSYAILTQQKETIRLGEDEFTDQLLHEAARKRAITVCRHLAELARSFQAEDIIAVATAATREAANQGTFLKAFNAETGIDLQIISGREEARLIYLGVSSGVHIEQRQALFLDVGGGSTEISIGNQREYVYLDSLKLGAIRLTTRFLADQAGPTPPARFAEIKQYVRNTAIRAIQHLRAYPFELAFGSSGTIENLASVAARVIRRRSPAQPQILALTDMHEVEKLLCGLSVEERRKVPGLNPERADIIIGGMAIISTLMEEINIPQITVSTRGLRFAAVMD